MVYYVYFIKTLDCYPAKTYVGYTNDLNNIISPLEEMLKKKNNLQEF